ncbi:hypothetical protein VTK73DRAFT_9741 [Phialemonium thermophilum]|uniref:Uncharacterized protein n=1 Tax=Phialemonium thermophilum TaxID=223376 RepID=A0ABR3W0N8_9PEZI
MSSHTWTVPIWGLARIRFFASAKGGQALGHSRVVRRRARFVVVAVVADDEPHDLVGVCVVAGGVQGVDGLVVAQRDVAAPPGREVDDDLVALAHREEDLVGSQRVGQQAGVRADDAERQPCRLSALVRLRALEEDVEGTRYGGIDDAQAVAARFDDEVRPGLAVDVDDVSIQAVHHVGGREEAPVRVVLLWFC